MCSPQRYQAVNFRGKGNRVAWKYSSQILDHLNVYEHNALPDSNIYYKVVAFACNLYDQYSLFSLFRCSIFQKLNVNIDTLAPTLDELHLNIMRSNF